MLQKYIFMCYVCVYINQVTQLLCNNRDGCNKKILNSKLTRTNDYF